MKFLCTSCERLVELDDFRLESGALVARCGKCGAENRASQLSASASASGSVSASSSLGGIASESSGPAEPAHEPLPPRAPLMLASSGHSNVVALRNPVSEAVDAAARSAPDAFAVPDGLCPKCLTPKPRGAAECPSCGLSFERFTPELIELPEWLRTAWIELLSTWGDEGRHEAIRTRALESGELAPVGRLYRLRLASQPLDPIASKGRDEVLRLALLPSTVTPRKSLNEKSAPWKWVAVGVFFLTFAGVLVALAWNLLKEH